MINAHLYESEILALIQSGLDPGEEVIAIWDFGIKKVDLPNIVCRITGGIKGQPKLADNIWTNCTFVLTNHHIRAIGFKPVSLWRTWGWYPVNLPKNPEIAVNSAFSLRAVSGISTSESKQNFLYNKVLQLTFWWDGKEKNLFTTALAEGNAFAGKFREVVANKDSSSTQVSMADELQKLTQLTKEGILSAEEYDRAKNRLIGVSSSQVDEATKLLRQLHELRVQGVLTESEYNMKKWDVLSQRLIPRDKSS